MQDLVIVWKNDGSHLYEQIYEHIKEEIRKGKLLYQEKLPSTRSLASYLQVSRSTVELAYEQLLSEGYIESVPYRGYFVARVEELYRFPEEGEREGSVLETKEGGFAADFSPNAVDMRFFPFGIWRRLTRSILSQDNAAVFSQGQAKGDRQLRETIVRYLHASRGVNCSANQLIVGAGNDFLLMLVSRLLEGEGTVAFENPTYPKAYRIFELFSGRTATVPSDEGGVRAKDLEKARAKAVYVMPSHQYPSGRIMPIGRRLELLHWAMQEEGRYIIEDDYDSEFRYRGKPVPSLQASDTAGKVIYIGTFSKSIAPAVRVSYMVLPKKLLRRYERQFSSFSSTVPGIDQAVLDAFIREGAFERHLNRMRKVYKEKHDCLLEGLRPLMEDFAVSGENAGLHVLLTDKRGRSEEWLTGRAKEAGVRVYGLSEAMVGGEKKEGPATVLLGFGGLTEEEIRRGTGLIKEAWNGEKPSFEKGKKEL